MTGEVKPLLSPPQLNALDQVKDLSPELAEAVRRFYEKALHPEQILPYADSWQAYTLADAYQARPPIQYIAGALFEVPSLNIVYGAPGTLKSFLLQDLAVCVAAGQEWLVPAPWQKPAGQEGIVTRRAPVMWCDFDNGSRRTHNRFEALGRVRRLPVDTPITYYSMPNPWLYATRPELIANLAARIKTQQAQLVIIDNLGVVSGDADENSSEMAGVMSQFRQLAEDCNAAIILIHHQRKSNGYSGRAGDSLRGHSSIEAALDLALLVERESTSSDTIMIRATKVRGAAILPFGAQFTYENKPDSIELAQARFYGLAGLDNESDRAVVREILLALDGEALNKSELTKRVQSALEETGGKVGVNRVRGMIERLDAEKRIRVSDGSKPREKVYSLPSND